MSTNLRPTDQMTHAGMDKKSSKTNTQQGKLRLVQNAHYRERGALTKRNGYVKINNSQATN